MESNIGSEVSQCAEKSSSLSCSFLSNGSIKNSKNLTFEFYFSYRPI
ncbi:hypothetical protein LEP1GSC162_1665 [Leptospira santarosai str. CBC1531]|nr:hypothetical protein LEP1GSC162_1665 [Leptospira santarosai str. CBC1531]